MYKTRKFKKTDILDIIADRHRAHRLEHMVFLPFNGRDPDVIVVTFGVLSEEDSYQYDFYQYDLSTWRMAMDDLPDEVECVKVKRSFTTRPNFQRVKETKFDN